MFLIERNLFSLLVTKIISKRFLVKFDSFQRPSPTFRFVAVSPNCLFLSKFQMLLSVLAQVWQKIFLSEKNFVLLLVMKTLSRLFSVCFTSFWRFQPIFSFCVVGPYLSFSSSKFKLILKRFGQKIYFSSEKMCFDISS